MKSTEVTQSAVDTLQNQIQRFTERIQENEKEIVELEGCLGQSMLDESGDVEVLKARLVGAEATRRGLLAAKLAAEHRLPEAQAELTKARQADGQGKVNEIGEALGPVVDELMHALEAAERFDRLIAEAFSIHNALGCSLTGLGGAIHYASPLAGYLRNTLGPLIENRPGK